MSGAYEEAVTIKADLEKALAAIGKGGENLYKDGQFLPTSMAEWGVALGNSYLLEINQKIVSKLNTSGMSTSEAKEYQTAALKELTFLDTQGWDKKGKKDYVKYLNAEYKNFQKDGILHLTADTDWMSPNGAGSLLIRGLHNFILTSQDYTYQKTEYKAQAGMPSLKGLTGKSEWTLTTTDGQSFHPAFLTYFGDDIPHLKVKTTTYEVRPLATSGQQTDPNHP